MSSPEEEIGCDLKVALYLARLHTNAACQVVLRAAAPLTPPACPAAVRLVR